MNISTLGLAHESAATLNLKGRIFSGNLCGAAGFAAGKEKTRRLKQLLYKSICRGILAPQF
jgi:hypothetical protein